MDLKDRTVLVLGGAGLVGMAVSRLVLRQRPRRLVVASLLQEEAEEAAATLDASLDTLLARGGRSGATPEIASTWGNLFVPAELNRQSRARTLADPESRRLLIDDVYGELTDEVIQRNTLGSLLLREKPDAIIDCVNTAGAMAYQNVFASATELRASADAGTVDVEAVERHLATLYLPQLIRHVQISLEGMRRAGTEVYVKIGTAGTGGMGLNIPFTHSEERPSRVLLAKSGLAGAHTLLLYLMARTPDAPAVKEVKPTAAISWKSIAYGPIRRRGQTVMRCDSTGPLPIEDAFHTDAAGFRDLDEALEGVYLDSGENGLFTVEEFEVLTALGLMEYVTPEEIAENVLREIQGHPSGKDVVSALDAATMGPSYRAGVLRTSAIRHMEALEEEHGVHCVAYEMLGPPRLSKLLFEAHILGMLFGSLEEAAAMDPEEAAERAGSLVMDDDDLRQRILTVGLPILLPDGERVLRGRIVHVPFEPQAPTRHRASDRGWVDLRPTNLERWRGRCSRYRASILARPGPEEGSGADHDDAADDRIRPGRLGAWIFRYEEEGERIKR